MDAQHQTGFNLIEILITLLLLSIIIAFALPTYQSHIIKAKRMEGKSALLQLAQKLEHFAIENQSYAKATTNKYSDNHFYQLKILKQNDFEFLIAAIPQFDDKNCGSFRLNQLGEKSITGKGNKNQCW